MQADTKSVQGNWIREASGVEQKETTSGVEQKETTLPKGALSSEQELANSYVKQSIGYHPRAHSELVVIL
jgi:hypothetical protein